MWPNAKIEIQINNPFKWFIFWICQNEMEFNIHLWLISFYFSKWKMQENQKLFKFNF